MLDLAWRLPAYVLSRRWGWPRLLPMSLTLSLTYHCNSRCATCNVWRKEVEELTVDEWERSLRSLGRAPHWITVSGGEPLLRDDAVEIMRLACEHCRPAIINIPTNGLLPKRIARAVGEVAAACPRTSFVVNLSLDGWGEDHDRIRGVPGNFERALETYHRLRTLKAPNLTLGVHTVISRFNAHRVPALYTRVQEELAPDSYITEIAEERVELGTMDADIAPSLEVYKDAIEQVMTRMSHPSQARHPPSGLGRVTRAFRRRYYRLVQQWLQERRQVIPCYAGWASAQISPEGDVWFCCVRAESVGNLREAGYDFGRVWWGERAQSLREDVRAGRCDCPLANAAYTNLLLHPSSLAGVTWDLVRGNGRR
ncbi:MAG: radical SAM protein [Chloroflexi bacterium]|nr:MAG: radical SAM protein [Chloroflexota bacterium]RLC83921.1 MAG: radical SAM protein [Chloroflexota bacterium]HEY74299.1 radical SAM protein [Thermoflexia bacterium]